MTTAPELTTAQRLYAYLADLDSRGELQGFPVTKITHDLAISFAELLMAKDDLIAARLLTFGGHSGSVPSLTLIQGLKVGGTE